MGVLWLLIFVRISRRAKAVVFGRILFNLTRDELRNIRLQFATRRYQLRKLLLFIFHHDVRALKYLTPLALLHFLCQVGNTVNWRVLSLKFLEVANITKQALTDGASRCLLPLELRTGRSIG